MSSPAVLYQAGDHASRPANGSGCVLYSCTDHDLVYRDDGTSWTTYMTLIGGSGGDIATDTIWDAAGDLVQGSGANAGAKLSAGLAGQTLRSAGAAAANAWAYPPGHEFDYAQFTAGVNITATSAATANTVVTGAAVAYDGSTVVTFEFYSNSVYLPQANASVTFCLYDGASSIGNFGGPYANVGATDLAVPVSGVFRRLTPSAATHTYSIRAFVGGAYTGVVGAGAGGVGNSMPGFLRITKV